MKFAKRISMIPPYPFVEISRKIAAKKAEGVDVISFGIGDPDIATPDFIIKSLEQAANNPINHRYPESDGLPEFKKAVADWYKNRFGVDLQPDSEVISLIGAKEGIGHASFCFIEDGDIALVPDPGYPVYSVGTMFASGKTYLMPLKKGNDFLPDLDSIPEDVAKKATVMWLNYPNNPTGAVADLDFFNQVVEFGKKFEIAILHDACYSEIAYDGYQPISFMQAPGAKEIGLEFQSLSKSHNMTGWRIGMAVGNADMVDSLMVIKSNLDSGVPQAIQQMAISALSTENEWETTRNQIYQRRRDLLCDALKSLGLELEAPKASLYVWVPIPDGYTSAGFSEAILEGCDIVVSSGSSYGDSGEGFIRFSLTLSDSDLDRAVKRLNSWKIPNP
jgi:LL-diaminopimelate aminotransferase